MVKIVAARRGGGFINVIHTDQTASLGDRYIYKWSDKDSEWCLVHVVLDERNLIFCRERNITTRKVIHII